MKLRHFSKTAIQQVLDTRDKQRVWWKPVGLWVSDEGPNSGRSWSQFCDNESGLLLGHIEHAVYLRASARVAWCRAASDIDAFHARFCARRPDLSNIDLIDWRAVAREYDGIIITPHCPERHLSEDDASTWYYTWDVASGCIWNPRAIAHISPIELERAA